MLVFNHKLKKYIYFTNRNNVQIQLFNNDKKLNRNYKGKPESFYTRRKK